MNELLVGAPRSPSRTRALIGAGVAVVAAVFVALLIHPLAAVPLVIVAATIPYWRPDRVLIAFLIATLLWPYTMGWQVGPLLWGPSRIMFTLLVLTWIFFWSKGKVRLERTPLDMALLLFVAVMMNSLIQNSLFMSEGQLLRALKTIGYSVVEWFALFYLVASIPSNWKQVRRFVVIASSLVFIVAVVGVIEYFIGFRVYEYLRQYLPGGEGMRPNLHEFGLQEGFFGLVRGGITRVVSTTISFQEVGTLMAMMIPFLMFLMAYARSWKQTIFYVTGLGFLVGALFLSVTRGAMLAAIIAVVFQSLFSRKRLLRSGVILGTAVVIITLFLFPKLFEAASSVASPDVFPQESTVQGRLEDWPEAAKLLKGNELLGIGIGQVQGKQLRYGEEIPVSFTSIDNYYLAAAVELGFLGIGFLLLIWGAIFGVLLQRRRLPAPLGVEIRDLRIAVLSSALAFMVMCFTFDALGFMTVSKFFWVIVGLGMALVRIEKKMAGEAAAS